MHSSPPNRPQITLPINDVPDPTLRLPKSDATEESLRGTLVESWSKISPHSGTGQEVSGGEVAWLCALANHPNAGKKLWEAMVQKLAGVPAEKFAPESLSAMKVLKATLEKWVQTEHFEPAPSDPRNNLPALSTPGTDATSAAAHAQPVGGTRLAAPIPKELEPYFHDLQSLSVVGDPRIRKTIKTPEDIFRYEKLVNASGLFTELKLDNDGRPILVAKPERKRLVEALETLPPFSVGTDRHLNRLPEHPGKATQRILYVGKSEQETRALKIVTAYYNSRGIAIDKNMAHIVDAGGGPIFTALVGENGPQDGVTHGGCFEIINLDPKLGPLSVAQIIKMLPDLQLAFFDKPVDYGNPTTALSNDRPSTYWHYQTLFNPHSITWDRAEKPGPKEFSGWLHAQQLWRVIDLITVGFSNDYPIPELADYKSNPVEITHAAQLPDMVNKMAKAFNRKAPGSAQARQELKWYAENCEEAKTNTRNMGLNVPINQKSVDHQMLTAESLAYFKEMEAVYTSVYRDAHGQLDEAKMYRTPKLGYEKLKSDGHLDETALRALELTGYINKPFVLNEPDLEGWMKYQPQSVEREKGKDGYGLPYRPMTMVGLVRMVLSSNAPRVELALGFQKQFEAILKKERTDPARLELEEEMKGRSVQDFAKIEAAKFQHTIVSRMKDTIYERLRFNELSTEDKKKIDGLWERTLTVIKDPDLALNREKLFERLDLLDTELREQVKLHLDGKEGRSFVYYPPHLIPHLARGMASFKSVGVEHLAIGVGKGWQKAHGPNP